MQVGVQREGHQNTNFRLDLLTWPPSIKMLFNILFRSLGCFLESTSTLRLSDAELIYPNTTATLKTGKASDLSPFSQAFVDEF